MKSKIELLRAYEDMTWDTVELIIDHDELLWWGVDDEAGDNYEAIAWEIARRYTEFVPIDKMILAAPYHFNYSDLLVDDDDWEEDEDWLDEDDYARYSADTYEEGED